MSKVTSLVFILVISVIGVRNSHGLNAGKFKLRGQTMGTAFTPFDKNENLNVSVVPQLAQYYKSKNITGVYVSAFYGGGPSLLLSDRKALVAAWAEQTNKLDMDLVVEIGAAPFLEVLAFAQFCSHYNVTALTAFAEIVYQPRVPSEVVEDLQRICDASNDLPLLYHELTIVDQEVGPVETYISACHQVSCFAGVIASIGKLTILRASISFANDCQFWVDTPDQTGPGLLLGMNAVTSPLTNLCPGLVLNLADAVNANKVKLVTLLQHYLNTVIIALCNSDGGVLDYTSRTCFENLKTAFYFKTGINTGVRYLLETPNSTVTKQIRSVMANLICY